MFTTNVYEIMVNYKSRNFLVAIIFLLIFLTNFSTFQWDPASVIFLVLSCVWFLAGYCTILKLKILLKKDYITYKKQWILLFFTWVAIPFRQYKVEIAYFRQEIPPIEDDVKQIKKVLIHSLIHRSIRCLILITFTILEPTVFELRFNGTDLIAYLISFILIFYLTISLLINSLSLKHQKLIKFFGYLTYNDYLLSLVKIHWAQNLIKNEVNLTKKEQEIINYVQEKHGIVNSKELMREFAVSATTLNTIFKKTFSKTYKQSLITLKMAFASDLIKQDVPIKEVAIMTGYDSISSFYKAFKKYH